MSMAIGVIIGSWAYSRGGVVQSISAGLGVLIGDWLHKSGNGKAVVAFLAQLMGAA